MVAYELVILGEATQVFLMDFYCLLVVVEDKTFIAKIDLS